MKLISKTDIENARKQAEESLRQVRHPHRVIEGEDLWLCWLQRIERALQMVKGKGPKAQELFRDLEAQYLARCQKADDDLAEYRKLCNIANQPVQAIEVRDCWCKGCES